MCRFYMALRHALHQYGFMPYVGEVTVNVGKVWFTNTKITKMLNCKI